MLDDLDTIVSQPQPALGAPAGVSVPMFMASDRADLNALIPEYIYQASAQTASSAHHSTRTLSGETLEELCRILTGDGNFLVQEISVLGLIDKHERTCLSFQR